VAGFLVMVPAAPAAAQDLKVDTGDTAWVLAAAALVMFMTPGLAFFYGGLVRSKNVLATVMQSFAALAVVSVVWALVGHTLAFGPDVGAVVGDGGWIGRLDFLGLSGAGAEPHPLAPTIPHLAYALYQMMFAVITPALISGAFAERIRFPSYLFFVALWSIFVYAPLAHWVWGGGFLGPDGIGALDFAGGTVVHLNAGTAALAAVLVIGPRRGWPREPMAPHNVPFVVLGASMLWFGWFGFNAGSALGSGALAASAFAATHLATAAAVFGWLLPEWIRHGRPSAVGAASGAVAGLVAITPASGYVRPWAALVIGFVAGAACEAAVGLKRRFGYDDSLDVVAVHGVGGALGALLTGLFATLAVNAAGADGVFYGNPGQLGRQAAAVGITLVWSFVVSLALLKLVDTVLPLRASAEEEEAGLDLSQHAESGYTLAEFGGYGVATRGGVLAGSVASAASEQALPEPQGPAPEPGPRISISRNQSAGPGAPAYLVRVVAKGVEAELPVWREPRLDDPHTQEAYRIELLGRPLERGNLGALEAVLRQRLGDVLAGGEAPAYVLHGSRGWVVPVFRRGRLLWATVEGQRVEGTDLSRLRRTVMERLAGRGAPHEPGEPGVLAVDSELRSVPPLLVLGDGDIWLPVFAAATGTVRVEVDGQSLEAGPSLQGILGLRDDAAQCLVESRRLRDFYDLTLQRVAPETWADWAMQLEPVGELRKTAGRSPIGGRAGDRSPEPATAYRSGVRHLAALRAVDGEMTVWCGRDRFDLASRVERGMRRPSALV
jgi:Amt family ammonium transporter